MMTLCRVILIFVLLLIMMTVTIQTYKVDSLAEQENDATRNYYRHCKNNSKPFDALQWERDRVARKAK